MGRRRRRRRRRRARLSLSVCRSSAGRRIWRRRSVRRKRGRSARGENDRAVFDPRAVRRRLRVAADEQAVELGPARHRPRARRKLSGASAARRGSAGRPPCRRHIDLDVEQPAVDLELRRDHRRNDLRLDGAASPGEGRKRRLLRNQREDRLAVLRRAPARDRPRGLRQQGGGGKGGLAEQSGDRARAQQRCAACGADFHPVMVQRTHSAPFAPTGDAHRLAYARVGAPTQRITQQSKVALTRRARMRIKQLI